MKTSLLYSIAFLFMIIGDTNAQCDLRYDKGQDVIFTNKHRNFRTFGAGAIEFAPDYPDDATYNDGFSNPVFSLGFTKTLWLAGFDPSDNLKVTGVLYQAGGQNDYTPGPHDPDLEETDAYCDFWFRTWKVEASEIVTLKHLVETGTLQNINQIPIDVLEWPAIGNPWIEDIAIGNDLAPFMDFNNDGVYNPMDGDYPIVYENNPDFIPYVFGFRVFNDYNYHTVSLGTPLDIEVHHLFYLMNCDDLGPSNHSVFHRLKIFNRGVSDLDQLHVGLFDDQDLGCYLDDYIGVDTIRNTSYVYNDSDGDAPSGLCGNVASVPGGWTAIRSTIFPNHKLQSHVYTNNNAVGGPPNLLNPQTAIEFLYYLQGLKRDGTAFTEGGLGIDPNNKPTQFVFPDLPNDPDGWSMANEYIPGDYRNVTTISVEDLNVFGSTEVEFIDYVYVNKNGLGYDAFEDWQLMVDVQTEEFQSIKNGNYSSSCQPNFTTCEMDCVWPGDTNNDRIVTVRDFVHLGVMDYQLLNSGPERQYTSNQWFPYQSNAWSSELNAINFKHGDCDGDGIIRKTDLNVIEKNYGLTTPSHVEREETMFESNNDDLKLILSKSILQGDSTASFLEKSTFFRLELGDQNSKLIEAVHGLSFTLSMDTSVFQLLNDQIILTDEFMYSFSDMNFVQLNKSLGSNLSEINFAFTNLSEGNIDSSAVLVGNNPIQLKEGLTTNNLDGRDTTYLTLSNVFALNTDGDTIFLNDVSRELIIEGLTYDPLTNSNDLVLDSKKIKVFPNPATDIINISSKATQRYDVIIYNIAGQIIETFQLKGSKNKLLNVTNYPEGIYFLSMNTQDGQNEILRFIKY